MTQLHQIDLVSTKVEDRRIRRTSPQSVLSALQTIEAYNIINATEPSRWHQNLEQVANWQKHGSTSKIRFRTATRNLPAKPYSPSSWIPSITWSENRNPSTMEQTTRDDTQMEATLQHLAANATIPNSPVRRTHDASTLAQMQATMMTAMQQQTAATYTNNRAPLPFQSDRTRTRVVTDPS
jgi:crotonobetainyl-CoA:carnitine CoA-transferase CaiB-like acyl-CoA transferase